MSTMLDKLRAKYNDSTVLAKKNASDVRVTKFIKNCERQIDYAEQMKSGITRPMRDGKEIISSVLGFGRDVSGSFGAKLRYGPRTLDAFNNGGQPQKCADLNEVIQFYQDFIGLAKSSPAEVDELIVAGL
jgi:hypothetical protein